MTFEGFMLELGKEWQSILLGFRLRIKAKLVNFKDEDGKKIQEQLRELLTKYGNNDFVCFAVFTNWVSIGQDFLVRFEPQGYAFLTEYLFRPRFKYALFYLYKNRGQGQKINVYTDLEKLVNDYIKIKKDFQEKEKLQKLQEDF